MRRLMSVGHAYSGDERLARERRRRGGGPLQPPSFVHSSAGQVGQGGKRRRSALEFYRHAPFQRALAQTASSRAQWSPMRHRTPPLAPVERGCSPYLH